jgi:predicted nucleic acid-binding protein
MASLPKRIYWDACAWIALIQKERIRDASGAVVEDREQMCRTVIEAAKKGSFEIATSALSYAEVCKDTNVRGKDEDQIASFFEHDFILPVALDRLIGEHSRALMLKGFSGLKPPDAIHVATAAFVSADEMHTFDSKLLSLSGLIDKRDSTKLKICKPDVGGAPGPLLQQMMSRQGA